MFSRPVVHGDRVCARLGPDGHFLGGGVPKQQAEVRHDDANVSAHRKDHARFEMGGVCVICGDDGGVRGGLIWCASEGGGGVVAQPSVEDPVLVEVTKPGNQGKDGVYK